MQKRPGTWDPEFVLFVYGPRYEDGRTEMAWKTDNDELLVAINNADARYVPSVYLFRGPPDGRITPARVALS